MSVNGLTSNALYGSNVGRVTQAIAKASNRTGVDFNYLMGQAQVESAMNPTARARTSSATGLYQFIDQSWLAIVHDHGSKYGMDWASNAIEQTSSGRYVVSDPMLRQQILDLRNHPETASIMAAELATDNRAHLESRIGRKAEPVDLYLAHFLGAGGAAKFLTSMQQAPNAPAASLFPAAARANASVFYDKQGNARSLADIRATFERKLNAGTQAAGSSASQPDMLPDTTQTVMPADYVRIAQERLALNQTLSEQQPYPEFAPRAETARLAYLMLATLGR
ncbi:MAG: lytic transglycosylase domain-containing protein [Alphaproteobacteria bacterium]|nr:lytic transglycosylase domain-containing protein [Alphaproteobacteria bacterium]MBU0793571.1 lytic transglycosylase domain-containing protein [Alphaproteobacteria bacterium]MBU0876262.1 lytic transglycosylase domain-containing protein [Alphaproteobacteria bacterium]MBU1768187.1 lytic transglycosylase domain-containing protein [Alphaproteobacteria bacterium]